MAKSGMSAGVDEEVAKLEKFADHARGLIGYALYGGAAVAVAAMAEAVGALPVDDTPGRPFNGPLNVITTQDKADLAASIGIAKFYDTEDGRGTSVGFDGYGSRTEPKYPGGVPLQMIARSIESGSSVRRKNPFVRRAERASKAAVLAAMQASADEYVSKYAGEET